MVDTIIGEDQLREKAKERTVRTQSFEIDLITLVTRIEREKIKLNPDYQRRHRWSNSIASRLIESFILNIPVPVIYLSLDFDVDTETEDARYSVIDGQQRLNAVYHFFKNNYPLENLTLLEWLNGYKYADLPSFLIRRLEERTIKCTVIDSTIDTKVKLDIFERLNSGSVSLNQQELRNAVFGGKFNTLCKNLATYDVFRRLLQIKGPNIEEHSKVKRMEDVEHVLRFYAFKDDKYKNYKRTKEHSFPEYLSEQLDIGNKLSDSDLNNFEQDFKKTMNIILDNFGEVAFAKYKEENGKIKLQSKCNSAVYDALSVAIYQEILLNNNTLSPQKVNAFKDLFKKINFYDSINFSSSDSNKILTRINEARSVLAA